MYQPKLVFNCLQITYDDSQMGNYAPYFNPEEVSVSYVSYDTVYIPVLSYLPQNTTATVTADMKSDVDNCAMKPGTDSFTLNADALNLYNSANASSKN